MSRLECAGHLPVQSAPVALPTSVPSTLLFSVWSGRKAAKRKRCAGPLRTVCVSGSRHIRGNLSLSNSTALRARTRSCVGSREDQVSIKHPWLVVMARLDGSHEHVLYDLGNGLRLVTGRNQCVYSTQAHSSLPPFALLPISLTITGSREIPRMWSPSNRCIEKDQLKERKKERKLTSHALDDRSAMLSLRSVVRGHTKSSLLGISRVWPTKKEEIPLMQRHGVPSAPLRASSDPLHCPSPMRWMRCRYSRHRVIKQAEQIGTPSRCINASTASMSLTNIKDLQKQREGGRCAHIDPLGNACSSHLLPTSTPFPSIVSF